MVRRCLMLVERIILINDEYVSEGWRLEEVFSISSEDISEFCIHEHHVIDINNTVP